jgi:tetratricopeptide (TPR) repeat protein
LNSLSRQKLIALAVCIWLGGVLGTSVQAQPSDYEKYLQQGSQFQDQGRYAEAEAAYVNAWQDFEQRSGPKYPLGVRILDSLGSVQVARRDYDSARATFQRSLAICEQARGPADPNFALVLADIAVTHHMQGRNAIAESMYHRALQILQQRAPAPESVYVGLVQLGLAKLLLTQRRNTEAEDLLERAVPLFNTSGAKAEEAEALTFLAEAYQMDGRYTKADPLYRRVLAMVEDERTLGREGVTLGLRHYAEMLRKMKRKTEARQVRVQVEALAPK